MHDYLPRREAELLSWTKQFSAAILTEPGPEAYGVSLAEAADYAAVVAAYAQAFQRAYEPSTRGPASVQAKKTAKKRVIALSRSLANLVGAQPGLTSTQRLELGLGPGHREAHRRQPIARPDFAPTVFVSGIEDGYVRLCLTDQETTGRKRPAGVYGALLFYYVGERLPGIVTDWAFGMSTKATRFGFTLPRKWGGSHVQPGTKVWLAACWLSPTLEPGPMSVPIYTRGGISEAPVTRRLGLAA